jgi:hypothetical protein
METVDDIINNVHLMTIEELENLKDVIEIELHKKKNRKLKIEGLV